MKNKGTGKEIVSSSCSECPSLFKLTPPADSRYKNPREKPTGDDFLKRIYECEDEQHRNTIYWEKNDPIVFVTANYTPNYMDDYGSLY